jgi:hypothetical protein
MVLLSTRGERIGVQDFLYGNIRDFAEADLLLLFLGLVGGLDHHAVTDDFLAVAHVRILESAAEGGGRTDVVGGIGVDQTDGSVHRWVVGQLFDFLYHPLAMQVADMSFVIAGADARRFGFCHPGHPLFADIETAADPLLRASKRYASAFGIRCHLQRDQPVVQRSPFRSLHRNLTLTCFLSDSLSRCWARAISI